MTAPATPAAGTVAAALAAHPNGITARDLAAAAGVGNSTAAKILTAMETAGTATRTPGPANGNRKTADIWHPATTDDAPADVVPADDAPADVVPADDAPADVVPADDAPADVVPADDAPAEAPVSGAPVSGAPGGSGDYLKVVMVAGVLGGYPDGVSAADVIDQSGLRAAVVARVLTAMEVAGAAIRKTGDGDDAPELWVRGDGDLSTVNLANAAPYRECVCACGHKHRVKTGVTVTARRAGGRTTGEINTDGSVKLAKNGLRNQVEAFMRDLGSGHEVTPGAVGRELGGRSSGAVLNAMGRLSEAGVLVMTSEAPVKYALADTPPAPVAEVAALMTRSAIGDDATPADATPADSAPVAA